MHAAGFTGGHAICSGQFCGENTLPFIKRTRERSTGAARKIVVEMVN